MFPGLVCRIAEPKAVAKSARNKTTKHKGAARKPAGGRKKTATRGAAPKRKAARRRSKKAARTTARKPAKATRRDRRKTAKKAGRGTVKKSARQAASVRTAKLPPVGPLAVAETPRKRSSRLTKKDLDHFRELLLVKRAQLIGDVTTLQDEALSKSRQDAAGDLSNMPIHMADLGTDNYEQEFTLGLIEGERAVLREIDEALQRIEEGTYGICAATGSPIGKARLRARPWAKYCYEYVMSLEQGQQSSGF